MPTKFVRTEWHGFEAQHRWEDLAVIAGVLVPVRPRVAVELGTAAGGFAAFLADTLAPWGGRVVTVDRTRHPAVDRLLAAYPTIQFVQGELLEAPLPEVVAALAADVPALLYCDDGNKTRELTLYGPFVPVGGLLGCHDYGSEVWPDVVDPALAALGYEMVAREAFEALAHPVDYPVSLTRLWRRVRGVEPGRLQATWAVVP